MDGANDFDFGAAFVQQRGRFECALPTADHENLLAGKLPEVAVYGCMRAHRTWEILKFLRPPRE